MKQGHRPAFVTRGYGGSKRGPLRVDLSMHTVVEVGDEALLLARVAPTWIGRDRVAAIREAEQSATHIILDDGLQNPNLLPTIALLIVDAVAGFGNGHVIPAGPLREPLKAALQRVDAVLVIGKDTASVRPYVGDIEIMKAHLQPIFQADFPRAEKFLAFAGIGRPEKFYASGRAVGLNIIGTHDFADHHVFSSSELEFLEDDARKRNARLLTTEKDFVRLPEAFRAGVNTMPVQLVFDDPAALTRFFASRSAA
jgi:tetraacyldisaccharide 4'-kinase